MFGLARRFVLALVVTTCACASGRDAGKEPRLTNDFNWDSCPFPREADDAGVDQASVELRVMVSENGRAENAEVLRDPGFGFAEAARDCAMRASYSPGRDEGGAPIRAMTKRFRVRFERPPPDTERASPTRRLHRSSPARVLL